MTAVIAGRPASVAGILISRLGRSTIFHSSIACGMVLSVSCASRGSTSIDTRPSTPSESSYCLASTSHALRTSSVVTVRIVGVDVGAALGELADLRVVGVALGQRGLEDRRVGGHADDRLGVDELLEVAGLQAVRGTGRRARRTRLRRTVRPGSGSGSCRSPFAGQLAMVRSAAATTASAVKPNSRNNVLSSADSP